MKLTPKEKAKDLFDKYQITGSKWYIEQTKKYALLCVKEILTELNKYENNNLGDLQYWVEVEYELNNL